MMDTLVNDLLNRIQLRLTFYMGIGFETGSGPQPFDTGYQWTKIYRVFDSQSKFKNQPKIFFLIIIEHCVLLFTVF